MKFSIDPWKAEWEMDIFRMNCGGSFQFLLLLLSFKSCLTLWPHGLQHTRIPCPSPSPGVCSNSCPLSQWCHPTISSSLTPLSSCPQSFPASGSFPVNRVFSSESALCNQVAKVWELPVNIQGWFPLGLIGLISLLFKGFSRVFSSTTIWKHQFLVSLPYGPILTSIYDYWKNHSWPYGLLSAK